MKQFPTMLVTLTNDAKDDANEATVYKGDLKSWRKLPFLEQFAVEKPDLDDEEKGGGGASDGASSGGKSSSAPGSRRVARIWV